MLNFSRYVTKRNEEKKIHKISALLIGKILRRKIKKTTFNKFFTKLKNIAKLSRGSDIIDVCV